MKDQTRLPEDSDTIVELIAIVCAFFMVMGVIAFIVSIVLLIKYIL